MALLEFVDFERYNELASYPLVKIVYFGKREKRDTYTLTKQTIYSYFVPSAILRHFHILAFFLDPTDLRIQNLG